MFRYYHFITSIGLEKYKVNGNPAADFGFDSPDAVSYFAPNNGVMYAKNGWWWTYDLNSGLLVSTGELSKVWGSTGSKAPAVRVSGSNKYPYSTGGAMAFAWAPEFIQSKLASGGQQLIFNQGAFWVWGSSATAPWKSSGLTQNLLAGAQGFNKNGNMIYPWTDGGPEAADVSQDKGAIILVNKGVAWSWTSSGVQAPVDISKNDHYQKAPEIAGQRPYDPQAIAQFNDGTYLRTGNGIPTNYQQVLFQRGRVWVNYNGQAWETHGSSYEGDIVNQGLSNKPLSSFITPTASPTPTSKPNCPGVEITTITGSCSGAGYQASVSWDAVAGATEYYLAYDDDNQFWNDNPEIGEPVSGAIATLASKSVAFTTDKTRYFRVRITKSNTCTPQNWLYGSVKAIAAPVCLEEDINRDGIINLVDYQTIRNSFTSYTIQLFNKIVRKLMGL